MSKSNQSQVHSARISSKHLQPGVIFKNFALQLKKGEVVSVKPHSDDTVRVQLSKVSLFSTYTTTSNGDSVEHNHRVVIAESSEDSLQLILTLGKDQRVVYEGLTDADRMAIRSAPTDQLTNALECRSEKERSEIANQLIATLSESEVRQLLRERNGGEST